jgi:asparagine N-glycosylation enzyme membrane subunit Stt3
MNEELQNQKVSLPNAVAVLVLGICSIVFSCAFIGLACGIVGLVLSSKGMKMYKEDPNIYLNYGMLNAGRITSIIGICISGLSILYYIFLAIIFGAAFATGGGFEGLENLIDASENCRMAF